MPLFSMEEVADRNYISRSEAAFLAQLRQYNPLLFDFVLKRTMRIKGKKFNPEIHEVIGQVESEDKDSGTVIEEVKKGYRLNGRLLRPSKVKVIK